MGVRFASGGLQALRDMHAPTSASELMQFLCALGWMRTSIPRFAELTFPLHTLLMECLDGKTRRTKAAIKSVALCRR